jgi:hypothetical protein
MAGFLEALVFAVVDPQSLTWFGAEPVEWSSQMVYSVTFLIFWGVIAAASAMTLALARPSVPNA